MPGRAYSAIVACASGGTALIAAVVWLESRPDDTLTRWSEIAGVIAAVAAVLALAAALVPLRSSGKDDQATTGQDAGTAAPTEPAGEVRQTIITSGGQSQAVGRGTINNNGSGGDK